VRRTREVGRDTFDSTVPASIEGDDVLVPLSMRSLGNHSAACTAKTV